jgi:hypothetical protein
MSAWHRGFAHRIAKTSSVRIMQQALSRRSATIAESPRVE